MRWIGLAEPLQREVVSDIEPDQVIRLQAELVSEGAPRGTRLGDLQSLRVDGVRDHVNATCRDVVEFFEVPLHHVAHRDDLRPAIGVILPSLDLAIHRILGVERFAQPIERLLRGGRKSPGVGQHAPPVGPALGDDHVVRPGVDQADGAVVGFLIEDRGGLPREVPDLAELRPPRRRDGHAADFRRQGVGIPGFGVEIDPMARVDEPTAKVDDVRFRTATRRVDPSKIQGQSHRSDLLPGLPFAVSSPGIGKDVSNLPRDSGVECPMFTNFRAPDCGRGSAPP